jgi:hypothetical protein
MGGLGDKQVLGGQFPIAAVREQYPNASRFLFVLRQFRECRGDLTLAIGENSTAAFRGSGGKATSSFAHQGAFGHGGENRRGQSSFVTHEQLALFRLQCGCDLV